jgi:hypothetical protein
LVFVWYEREILRLKDPRAFAERQVKRLEALEREHADEIDPGVDRCVRDAVRK